MSKSISFSSAFRLLALALFVTLTVQVKAQRRPADYQVAGGVVLYCGTPLSMADVYSFVNLGHGYAKDAYRVYYLGDVLRYVDPRTFRLKRDDYHRPYDGDDGFMYRSRGYMIMSHAVLFNGKNVEGASARSFQDLGGYYGKDTFNVFFMGRKLSGTSSNSFRYLGDGYAKDSFDVYFMGRKVNGASASSFQVVGDGYAEDTFNTYYQGQKVAD